VTVIFCGPVGSVSPMLRVALKLPTALGVNVMLNVHDEFAGTTAGVPQVLVCAKSF
jgi:hypothetical protein